jgi:hypothetical protein
MVDAWVTDAQVLGDSKTVRKIEHAVLLRTNAVEQLLERSHRPSSALVAPKGFGKTFVLKVKRVALEGEKVHCLPQGNIVDRPFTGAPTLSHDQIALLSKSSAWQAIWAIAISFCVLRAAQESSVREILDPDLSPIKSPVLRGLVDSSTISTPFQVVDYMLRLSRKHLISAFEASGEIVSYFTNVREKTALFIDNIDEYVDEYLKSYNSRTSSPDAALSQLWNSAQIGAWLAIRQLQGVNPHVRVYFSLRKEAYHFALSYEPLFSNLDEAFSVELKYDLDDLVSIIENNIKIEAPTNLVAHDSHDLITRFVGLEAVSVTNSGTGATENILDYWLRHCVGRPRDAVFIGLQISKILPVKRSGSTVRDAINLASDTSVSKLINESQHHLSGFDAELIARIMPGNVLSRADLETTSKEYEDLYRRDYGEAGNHEGHVFCSLYSLGLIGILREDEIDPGRYYQDFPPVGQYPVSKVHVLPRADYYFLHPAFADFIIARDATFVSRLHRYNIIGHGKEWREPTDYVFVIVGDIASYRASIMNRPGPSKSFPEFWRKSFDRATRELQHSDTSGGDSFVLADRSPKKIYNACRSLARQLKTSDFSLNLRAGGHSGFWRLQGLDSDDPGISEIIGVAARIEPHADHGTLFVSEQFYRGVEATHDPKLIAAFSSISDSAERGPGETPGTIISKKHEPLEAVRLFRAPLTAD